jgi:hypothetical protein
MHDFGGGRRGLKLAWVINFQKLTTIPLLAIFMLNYHNFTVAAWIYTSMQSSKCSAASTVVAHTLPSLLVAPWVAIVAIR